MYATIDVIQGKQGEKRLVISLNGKVSSLAGVEAACCYGHILKGQLQVCALRCSSCLTWSRRLRTTLQSLPNSHAPQTASQCPDV